MKILHTAHVYPPEASGVSRILSEISRALVQRGHEVHVATQTMAGEPLFEESEGVHIHRFDVGGNAVRGIHGEAKQYVEFVLSGNWDVVSMFNAQIWSTDLLLDHVPRLGHVILSLSGLTAGNYPEYAGYLERLSVAAESLDQIVCISRVTGDWAFFEPRFPAKTRVIPNGVDLAEWARPPMDLRVRWGIGSRPWVVNVSNHNREKDHARFFEVVRGLRRYLPGVTATVIGNPYPQRRWPALSQIGINGGCWYACRMRALTQSAVSLRAGLSRQEVVSAMLEADVFLMTSAWEASPIVIAESMAAGTPWVSTSVGDVPWQAGGLVAKESSDLVRACLSVLETSELRERLSLAGKIAVQSRAWDSLAAQYEELYTTAAADSLRAQ